MWLSLYTNIIDSFSGIHNMLITFSDVFVGRMCLLFIYMYLTTLPWHLVPIQCMPKIYSWFFGLLCYGLWTVHNELVWLIHPHSLRLLHYNWGNYNATPHPATFYGTYIYIYIWILLPSIVKIAAIVQMILSNDFSWMKFDAFCCNLQPKVQPTIRRQRFREWFVEQATSHYLNQRWPSINIA